MATAEEIRPAELAVDARVAYRAEPPAFVAFVEARRTNARAGELLWAAPELGGRFNRGSEFFRPLLSVEGYMAPSVSDVDPEAGEAITPLTLLRFTLAPNGNPTVLLVVELADGRAEVAHDGAAFRGPYSNPRSTRVASGTGYAFTLWRSGGWSVAPTLAVYGVM